MGASSDTALLRNWLLGTVTVFEVSQRQENKENQPFLPMRV